MILDKISYQRGFFRRLTMINTVQYLTLSVTGMIDSAIAGHCCGESGLAAMKLAMPVYSVLSLCSTVISSGFSVRAARELESGQKEAAAQTFLCSFGSGLLFSLVLTLAGIFSSGPLALLLSGGLRDAALLREVAAYLRPVLSGSVFIIFFGILGTVVLMEGGGIRIWVSSLVILAADIAGDLAAVQLNAGITGIAAASVFAYACATLVLAGHLKGGSSFFRLARPNLHPQTLRGILLDGSPMGVRYLCLLLCPLVINRLMIRYGTIPGLAALSIQDALHYLPKSFCEGISAAILLLTGIYAAEQSREDLGEERRFFLYYGLTAGSALAALLALAAPQLLRLFTPDEALRALGLSAFRWYLLGVPFVALNLGLISYCQGMGRQRTALVLTVLHTLVLPCLVTRVLAGRFGMTGIYAAFAVHEIFLALICGLLWLCAGRQARSRLTGGGDWDRTLFALERPMHTFADVTAASKEVLRCCRKAGIHERQAVHIALCLEELGTNSIEHNTKLRHPLRLSARFIIGEKWLILRMRNNGRPYDLTERYAMLNPKEPTSHIGLRLVYASADEVRYSHFLDLNNVCIRVAVKRQ